MLICKRSTRRCRSILCNCMRAIDSASTAAVVVAAEIAEVADEITDADNTATSARVCLTAAFFGDVKAPLPVIEANVETAAALLASRSALILPEMGDILRRERPLAPLPSPAKSVIAELLDGGDCGGVFNAFLAAVSACDLASLRFLSSMDINASMAAKKLLGSSGCSVGNECDAANDLAATNSSGGGGWGGGAAAADCDTTFAFSSPNLAFAALYIFFTS